MGQPFYSALLTKFFLGITLAAPLGPVSIEMIKRGLTKGFLSSFSVRCGGVIGNALCLILSLAGLTKIAQSPMVSNGLTLIGATLLCYMGLKTWRQTSQSFSLDTTNQTDQSGKNGLFLGLYLSLANPIAFVFWPSIFAADMETSPGFTLSNGNVMETFLVLIPNLMILVGILLWGAGLAYLSSLGRKKLSEKRLVFVSRTSAVLLIAFGLKYLISVLARLI